jgi:hypothetical protein
MSMMANYLRISPKQLEALRANPSSILDLLYPPDFSQLVNHLDIDRGWHVIHFLLNGETWDGQPPLVNAVLGGHALGDVDVGYGPARFLEPDEVRDLASALENIPSAEFIERSDPLAL